LLSNFCFFLSIFFPRVGAFMDSSHWRCRFGHQQRQVLMTVISLERRLLRTQEHKQIPLPTREAPVSSCGFCVLQAPPRGTTSRADATKDLLRFGRRRMFMTGPFLDSRLPPPPRLPSSVKLTTLREPKNKRSKTW
jgi:hypothetical protein